MDGLPEIEVSWKRPAQIKHPNIWHRFETKPKNSKTYKIRIEDLTEDRFEEAMEFMQKYYFNEEPLSVTSKLVEDELSFMIYQYLLSKVMAQNTSIVAVIDDDTPKPEMVGLQILSVASKDDSPLPEVPGEAIGKNKKIYNDIRENCNPYEILGSDAYLHEWGICVAPEFRRLGIGLNILNTLTSIGKTYGLKGTMIMFTRTESQKLAEKAGFKTENEITYKNYKDEDGNVLFPIESSKSLKFMSKIF